MRSRTKQASTLACLALMAGMGCAHAPEDGLAPPDARPDTSILPALDAPAGSSARMVLLEALFWACDYVATTRGIDATPIGPCTSATRELRRVKFGGSFHRMLDWWQANKQDEHRKRRLERGDPEH